MQRICIIMNPVAGRHLHEGVEWACGALEAEGVKAEVWPTRWAGEATVLAQRALSKKFDIIGAAGGDGTVNEVVNGMAHSKTPLVLLPIGTANVLAREIGVYRSLGRAVAAIVKGKAERIHLGRAGARYFLLMAGVGFDAQVVHALNRRLKSVAGKLAYIIAALKITALHAPKKCIEIAVDDEPLLRCSSFILGNARYYGGSFEVTPRAGLSKPGLELCAFAGETRRSIFRYALGVVFKRHVKFKDVAMRTVRQVSATACCAETAVQVDGDYLGSLPLEFRSVPDALTILRPPPLPPS